MYKTDIISISGPVGKIFVFYYEQVVTFTENIPNSQYQAHLYQSNI